MDPQLLIALEDYPSLADYRPLPFLGAWAMTDLGQLVL